MQVDKFFLLTLLSGYSFFSNNSNWGHSTSMLHTTGSVASVIYSSHVTYTYIMSKHYTDEYRLASLVKLQHHPAVQHSAATPSSNTATLSSSAATPSNSATTKERGAGPQVGLPSPVTLLHALCYRL